MCVLVTVGMKMNICENMFVNKHVPEYLWVCVCEKAHALRKRIWIHMIVEEKNKCQEIHPWDLGWS